MVNPAPVAASLDVIELDITGMHCAGCVGRVEKALNASPGVTDCHVNLATERARIFTTAIDVSASSLVHVVEETGFGAKVSEPDQMAVSDTDFEAASRRDLKMVLFAAVLSAPMLAQMAAMWLGIGAFLEPWHQLLLTAPVQFIAGARFYRPAWYAAKDLSGNMDLLVVTGTLAAFGLSTFNVIRGEGSLYFEAAASVITLVLLGKWMESRARRSATSALRGLMQLRPETVRILRNGEEFEIPAASLANGDQFVVRPSERIAADGVVTEGQAAVDESLLTGESVPVPKQPGDPVTGGAANVDGLLTISATAVGTDSTLSRIVRVVDQAQGEKAPIQRFVDRVAHVFVPIVLLIALVTFVGWLIGGEQAGNALINAVTVLVVACPCALGLATPTAITVGTGVAARHGILIRHISALERIHHVTTVVFDKTGTLTEGKPDVISVMPLTDGISPEEVLALAASVQSDSEHPLARAIVRHAHTQNLEINSVTDFGSTPGKGVSARIGGSDRRIHVGSAHYLSEQMITLSPPDGSEDPATKVWVAEQGAGDARVLGVIRLTDAVRPGAANAIGALSAENIATVLLSGDTEPIARSVANEIGIQTVRAGVLPEHKAREIKQLQETGQVVAMVGDGVNDAPALATSDVGIAMGGGADIAVDAADLTLMKPSPERVVDAVHISRATHHKIHQNLFWAFIYNIVALPLAASGTMSPVLAGAAMALSSVSVVTNSLLLRRWQPLNRERMQ